MDTIPEMTEEEKKFFDIKNTLKEKYSKYKDISNNLEAIKQHEKMEEDLKRNEITPDPSTNDEKIKLLCSKKDEYQKEYEEGYLLSESFSLNQSHRHLSHCMNIFPLQYLDSLNKSDYHLMKQTIKIFWIQSRK